MSDRPIIGVTVGTPINPHKFGSADMIVEGALNPANLSAESLNKSYFAIAEALKLKKDVRLLLSIPFGEDDVVTVLGTVETFRPQEGVIEFGVILDTTLDEEGEQVYHFRITLTEDESVSVQYKTLSGNDSGGEAVSPTVEVTQIEGGHRVEITDVNGTDSFDVMNGEKGNKGDSFTYEDFTPEQLESLKGEKGDAFTYDDFTAEQLNALKGEKGDSFTYEDFTDEQLESLKVKGDKGDTPQKGVDYYTPAEKDEFVTAVLNALPVWNGGSY